jgi:hypothetical protein
MRRRDELTAYNERLGLAVIAVGVLRPLIDKDVGPSWGIAVYIIIAVALHAAAHYIVSQVETET